MSHTLKTAALSALAVACVAGTARGDITQWWYINSNSFGLAMKHMPDFDQKRIAGSGHTGLPGSGAMYCVPTATVNLFAYIANHGYPAVGPGYGNWQLQSKYEQATVTIKNVGFLMNTDAADGTGGYDWRDGAKIWLAGHPYLDVNFYWAQGLDGITLKEMTQAVINGGVVAFAYGRYNEAGTAFGQPNLGTRTGGHAVTLTGSFKNGSYEEITYRDPADDDYNSSQSIFGNTFYNTRTIPFVFDGSPFNLRVCTEIITNLNDGKRRIIDSYMSIKPKWGLTYQPGEDFLTPIFPWGVIGSIEIPQQLPLNLPLELVQAVMTPSQSTVLTLSSTATNDMVLHEVNPATGEVTEVPAPPRLRQLMFGRQHQLYATDGIKTYCLDYYNDNAIAAELNFGALDMVFDDSTDKVGLLRPGGIIEWFNKGLGPSQYRWILPTSIPLGDTVKIFPSNSPYKVWLVSSASDMIYGISQPGQGIGPLSIETIANFEIQNPTSVCEDAAGNLIVACDGSVKYFVPVVGAGWQYDPTSPWDGIAVGANFCTSRSRDNFDPAIHSGPAWDNIIPEQLAHGIFLPDCPGDLDGNQRVDVNDLNQLLAGWGTASLSSDVNRNGVTDVDDLNMVLTNWNNSCVDLPCPGDADGNGVVNVDDLNLVLSNWLTAEDVGDFNADGVVDVDDLNDLLSHWQDNCL